MPLEKLADPILNAQQITAPGTPDELSSQSRYANMFLLTTSNEPTIARPIAMGIQAFNLGTFNVHAYFTFREQAQFNADKRHIRNRQELTWQQVTWSSNISKRCTETLWHHHHRL